jgi:hypothetical protein
MVTIEEKIKNKILEEEKEQLNNEIKDHINLSPK